jgi:hypothetical protein
MHANNRFGLRNIQLLKAALRADGFVQQRPHRSISDKDSVLDARVEIFNSHWKIEKTVY